MKKWICMLMTALLTCAPALADIPMEPWPTQKPKLAGSGCILMRHPILLVAVVLVAASIVLWLAIRAHKAK